MDTTTRPILDLLIALVDQNLLRAREVDGEPRFELLRTIQEYAAEQLVRSGELHDVQQRHALYYLDLVERGDAAGHGRLPDNTSWLVQVCTSVAEPGAFEREVRALAEAAGLYPYATPLLLTLDSLPPRQVLPASLRWQPAGAWFLGDPLTD